MNWSDIAGVVGKAAPILGTLVGGPAGTIIGGLISSALGVANTPDAIHNAIATDPEAALKLASLESDNKVKLQAMMLAHADNEIAAATAGLQSDTEDRKSAREREIAIKGKTPAALAWLIILGSISLCVAIVMGWATKDPAQAVLLGTVVGYLFGEAKQVLTYYFGSSQGSDRKTELMAKATPAAEPNTSTAV